jgi:hypothetical protein
MPFEARIQAICAELAVCKDDQRSLELARELREALHEEIELMRSKATNITLLKSATTPSK